MHKHLISIPSLFSAVATGAFIALFMLASVADAHRTGNSKQERNQYLQLVCEATATTPATDTNPLDPDVQVGEVCRVDTTTSLAFDAMRVAHNTNNSLHATGSTTHNNARYRWVIEPAPGGTCTGDPATTGAKNIPSGGAYTDQVTAGVAGFFAVAGTNQTYTVVAEDAGKCIYALVFFDNTLRSPDATSRHYHATINPRNAIGVGSLTAGFTIDPYVTVAGGTMMPAANTAATGAPTVTPTTPATAPTEDNELTATTTGITDPDGIGTVTWQWQSADAPDSGTPAAGDYTDIMGQTSATFTPGDDEAGRYVRVCASFMDMHATPNSEGPLCNAPAAAVINVNDAPVGLPYLVNGTGSFLAAVASAPTSLTQGQKVATVLSTSGSTGTGMPNGGPVSDDDGIPTGTSGTWRQSIQSGTSNSGPWVERTNNDASANPIGYDLTQEDVNRGWVRTCAFYRDEQGTLEGAPSSTTATNEDNLTQAERLAGTLCSTPVRVNNANDAPTATSATISVATNGMHTFTAANFAFTDVDDPADSLEGVIIETVPAAGTLANDGTALTGQTTIAVADIGGLVYTPATSAADGDMATFTFNVIDDGSDGTDGKTSTNTATITMSIIAAGNNAAVAGAVTAADGTDLSTTGPNEDNLLTAAAPTDADGTSGVTFTWEWAEADSNGGAYTAISGATNPTFTPLQAQVGKFLRVCASFTDEANNSENACTSLAHAVVNVNDAPSGRPIMLVREALLGDTQIGTSGSYTVTSMTENSPLGVYRVQRTSAGGVVDEDGFPIGTESRLSWQTGSAADGWNEIAQTQGIQRPNTSLDDSHVDHGFFRVCFFYTDNGGTAEGGDRSAQAGREAGTLCSVPIPIANTNTKPTATDGSATANSNLGHTFAAGDFPFTDGDSPADSLASVTIISLPAANSGTLSNSGTAIASADLPVTIAAADIGNLTYAPDSNASDGDTATFTYSITDDGSDTHPLVGTSSASFLITEAHGTTSATATFTLTIRVQPNNPATGAPVVVTVDEPHSSVTHPRVGTIYSSGTFPAPTTGGGTIADADGVTAAAANALGLTRSWQRSSDGITWTEPTTGDPDERTYRIQPDDYTAGQVRVCVFFDDDLGNAEGGDRSTKAGREAGTLCSAALSVNAPGTVSLAYGGHAAPTLGTAVTASINDSDGTTTSAPTWVWERSDTMDGAKVTISGATAASYTPVTADIGKFLHATATYTDDDGVAEEAEATSPSKVNAPPTGSIVVNTFGGSGPGLTSFKVGTRYYPGVTTGGGNLADANGGLGHNADGFTNDTVTVSWQNSADSGTTWSEQFMPGPGAGVSAFAYEPNAADGTAGHIRVCLFYTDSDGHVEGGPRGTAAERDVGTICSAALPLFTNTAPSGGVTVADAGNTDFATTGPTEGEGLSADASTVADADGLGAFTWTWQSAAAPMSGLPAAGDYSDIDNSANAANPHRYTPVDDDVGRHLRACVSYTDGGGTDEQLCFTFAHTVINVNVVATGMANIVGVNSSGGNPNGNISTVAQGGYLLTALNTNGATVSDPEIRTESRGSAPAYWRQSIQRTRDTTNGPWTESFTTLYEDGTRINDNPYQVTQADVDAGNLRACVFFTDRHGTAEGGDGSNANSRVINPTLCSDHIAVTNINDAPSAAASEVTGANTRAYAFAAGDFMFTDPDGDELASVIIESLPALGTLAVGSTTLTTGNLAAQGTVAVANIATLTFTPADSAPVGDAYTTFTFNVVDDGSDGSSDRTSTTAATMTINLSQAPNTAATGQPSLAYTAPATAATEDSAITADASPVMDANGITNRATAITIQWQQDVAGNGVFTNISGATGTSYSPGDDQVGHALRACASFTDDDGHSENQCSDATDPVININDLPTGVITIFDGGSNANLTTVAEDETIYTNLTTAPGTLMDLDGLPAIGNGNLATQNARLQTVSWQRGTSNSGPWEEAQWNVANSNNHLFEPGDAEVAAGFVRYCIFYTDARGTAEGGPSSTAAERVAGTLCSAAITITNVNDDPVGTLAWLDTDSNIVTQLTEDEVYSFTATSNGAGEFAGRVMDDDGLPDAMGGTGDFFIANYSFQRKNGANWTESQYSTPTTALTDPMTSYTIADADVDAGALRICMFYTDKQGTAEGGDDTDAGTRASSASICSAETAVINVNDAPSGMPTLSTVVSSTANTSNYAIETANPGTLDEGQRVDVGLSTGGSTVMDDDGGIPTNSVWMHSLQIASDQGGPWTELQFRNGTAPVRAYTITQADANMGWMRGCAFYVDAHGTLEGAPDGSTADNLAGLTEANRLAGTLCSASVQVRNVNDAPVATASTVDASQDISYTFQATDFMFTDADGDNLVSVTIASLPTGTLSLGGTALTSGNLAANGTIMAGDISTLTFRNADGAAVGTTDTFTFNVTDDGDGPGGTTTADLTSTTAATMTVNITAQVTNAAGAPVMDCAANPTEDAACEASQGSISDADGLGVLRWQWHAGTPDNADPTNAAAASYAPISAATSARFSPEQAQVDHFLRVCASFTDTVGNREGPLCVNSSAPVTNTNDAPTGMPWLALVTIANSAVVPESSGNPPSSLAQNQQVISVLSSAGEVVSGTTGPVMDDDGLPDYADRHLWAQSIQTGPSDSGPWTEVNFETGGGFSSTVHTITQADADMGYMRTCVFYEDNYGGLEGVSDKIAAAVSPTNLRDEITEAQRLGGTLCSTPLAVANVNDAPVPADADVMVFFNATQTAPHTLGIGLFNFTDADGDMLVSISIPAAPTAGTIELDGNAASYPQTVTRAQLEDGDLVYYPASGLNAAADDYATFTFNVTDDGDAGTGVTTSTSTGTITINLIVPGPVVASGNPTVAAATGISFAEDNELTAATTGINEPNGINAATVMWIWQTADAPQTGTPADADYSTITGAPVADATFTPLQVHVGQYLRACAFFMDELGSDDGGPTAEGGTAEAPTLCSVGTVVTNTNDAPTGTPSLGQVANTGINPIIDGDITAVVEGTFIAASLTTAGGTVADEDGFSISNGKTVFSYSLQRGTDNNGTISWAESATGSVQFVQNVAYEVAQADVNAGLIRACVFYTDAGGTAEGGDSTTESGRLGGTLCSAALPVTNVNDAPSGQPYLALVSVSGDNVVPESSGNPPTSLAEDQVVMSVLSTAGDVVPGTSGPVGDEDGVPSAKERWSHSVQTASSANGPWSEVHYALATAHSAGIVHTITQADANAGYMRSCVFYTDDQGTDEGGASSTAAQRIAGSLCSAALAVANVDDAPVAVASTARVFTTRTQTTPHVFSIAEFMYTDEDDDALASVTIESLPDTSKGSLHIGGSAAAISAVVTAAQLTAGEMTYWPIANQDPNTMYDTFTFNVTDDGATNNASTTAATMTIALAPPGPVPATGAPTVTAASGTAYHEDNPLTAATTGINEPNGIDTATLRWQWQQGAAADGAFAAIAGANAAGFTPLQANVGQYIRVCVWFMDLNVESDGTTPDARAEGPLCSTPAQVINVNDAPVSADSAVNVFTIADADMPYNFKVGDFPFTDEDVGANSTLASVTIVSITNANGGTFTNDGTAVTANTTVAMADIGGLAFYPAADTEATPNYASFTFTVSDGLASSVAATMTINVIPPGPIPATGMPTVTAATGTAYDEDVELTASTQGVTDPNGINAETLQWQWQLFDAATGTYMPIEGATAATFTPLNEHGDGYIRVCLRFMDTHVDRTGDEETPDPRAEGPLCSIHAQVRAINDAPTTADNTVNVMVGAATEEAPFAFTAEHFAYTDEEGADLAHITIVSLPTAGTLRTATTEDGTTTYAAATVGNIMPDAIASLRYHPAAGATATQGYATFTFTVNDGNSDSSPASTITINLVPGDQVAATGAPAVAAATGMTAYNEDVALTASTSGITEPNTLDPSTLEWQWQQHAPVMEEGSTTPTAPAADSTDWADIEDADGAEFTPLQAHVGQYIRVCASFADQHSTPATSTLCTEGVIIVNVDDTATGMVTLAATGVDLDMAGPNEDAAITASHNIMDGDGLATGDDAPSWQWGMADAAAGPYSDIADATSASFTPLQAHVGKFLQACLSYQDTNGNTGEACANTAMAVVNVNDAATMVEDTSLISYASGVMAATEDSVITAAANANNIMDEDGITGAVFTYAWQQAASADGPFAAIMEGETAVTTAAFTPGDAQVGMILRVCVSFTDDMNVATTTGMGMAAMTVNSGAEMLCEATMAVANVNDAPVAAASTIHVLATATADAGAHTFSAGDFPFTDVDGDALASISIVAAPNAGTLALDGTAIATYPATVTAEQLSGAGDLTWYPAEGQTAAMRNYASIDFTVTDDGEDGESNTTSAAAALTINLTVGEQMAATGDPAVAATDTTMTAYNEDVELTATPNDIADANGLDTASLAWQWQQADAVMEEGSTTPTAPAADSDGWADIMGADKAAFTPLQAQVDKYIRACANFMDRHSTPNAETRCSTGTVVTGVDDAVTGAPAVVAADRINLATTSAHEGVAITASQGTIADEDGLPEPFAADWVWYMSDDAPAPANMPQPTYTEITGAGTTAAATSEFTPTQADHIGKYLRVCATVTGDTGAGNPRCHALPHPVANFNDPATVAEGSALISYAGSIEAATEDSPITASMTGITDKDGLANATYTWQWHQAESADGDFEAIEGATAATFTPLQANVGHVLRACVSFTDDLGGAEQLCMTAMDSSGDEPVASPVANVNDAPVAGAGMVYVPFAATSESGAYTFAAGDFPFTDEDEDALVSVSITTLPAAGTLALDGTALTAVPADAIAVADLGTLSYYPATGLTAGAENYATIMFTVTDDGDAPDATTSTTSAAAALTINLVDGEQMAATGVPTVTPAASPAYTEDAELNVAMGSIADVNGIDATTLAWQWQDADAPEVAEGETATAPADGDYSDIAEATEATFTPLQAQAGKYLRVCATFMDRHGSPASETRCTDGALVTDVNGAPESADSFVLVPANVNADAPFMFAAANFDYEDEEGSDLASITIVTLPAVGTLRTIVASETEGDDPTITAVTAGAIIMADAIATLSYHPAGGTQVTRDYASFTYTVNDGMLDSTPASTMTINIVSPQQLVAMGAPTVTPAAATFDEDAELSASTQGIVEYNLINEDTVTWQWQWGRSADGLFTDLAEATEATITPLQEHVGLWLRACASFMDRADTPASEGPLCSASGRVVNVNDAPTSDDNFVSVFTVADAATPYLFTTADFPITDEDGDTLASVTLASLPVRGTLMVGDKLAAVNDTIIMAAEMDDDIDTMSFYPAAGTEAEMGYDSFTFTVSDGALRSSPASTMTVNVILPGQLAATGTPVLDSQVPTQGNAITASLGSVRDPNRIDATTISWQWQQSDSAAGTFTDIEGGTSAAFVPGQAQVNNYIRACMSFMDLFANADGEAMPNAEGPLCSAATGPTADVNDAPLASHITFQPDLSGGLGNLVIPAEVFQRAYSDPDAEADMLESVTIVGLPATALGTLNLGGTPVVVTNAAGQTVGQRLTISSGAHFEEGTLSFAANTGTSTATISFIVSDGELNSVVPGSITLVIGSDISKEQVQQVSAVLSVAAVTNATNAIGGALGGSITGAGGAGQNPGFDVSVGGTSLMGFSQSLQSGLTGHSAGAAASDNGDLPSTMATADQRAWFLGTHDGWEYNAAYNASDNSAASLQSRLNAMANGDIAMQFGAGGAADMRYWARFQRLDISGNPTQDDGTMLAYDGSSTGFYVGADRLVGDNMRAGLAIGMDSADITLTLDEGNNDEDEASRSATSIYPYLRVDMGGGNEARLIAGFGSGDLDITSSSSGTASAGLSWMMLAGNISHSRNLDNSLRAKFSGSLQYSDSSNDEATFSDAPTARVQASTANSGELAFSGELGYGQGNINPFVNATARKWFGDLNQSLAYDLGTGVDISSGSVNLRLAATRQINDTTHERHSVSVDIGFNPSAQGLSATFGNRWDSLRNKPQWTSTIKWQRGAFQASLQAAQTDWRLHGKLRW